MNQQDNKAVSSAPNIIAMQELLLAQQQLNQEDEIDLAELWSAIWQGKLLIIVISALFAVASVFFALSLPNQYKATVVLQPVSDSGGAGGLSKLAGQFGGLASLAGINLGGSGSDKTTVTLAVLKSRAFIEKFIQKHNLLVPLMAAKGWDRTSNQLLMDDEIYDVQNQKWLIISRTTMKPGPSAWQAYDRFSKIFTVIKDDETGLISLTIEYYSPVLAKQWLNWLVIDLNNEIKTKAQQEAENSINFLKDKIATTELADMQKVFYQLIEEQTKTLMLTEVSQEYALKTIDPANVPDRKSKPKRALIVIFSTLLGGVLATLIVLIRYYKK